VAPLQRVGNDTTHWTIDWADPRPWHTLAEVVKATAQRLEVVVEWGGDWTSFKDLPHWQLPKV
jgi:peptidoglycan L-alanyl-D-glutamate endopeptidase CwlK